MNQQFKSLENKGFTLIELVLVIVILGILAVTAAPKFLNLQDDARTATLKALNGSINSAINIVYGKAVIKGIEHQESGSVEGIDTIFGYPTATFENLSKVVDGIEDGPWITYLEEDNCGVNGCLMLGYAGQEFDENLCAVVYFNAQAYSVNDTYPGKSYFMGESCGGLALSEIDHFN